MAVDRFLEALLFNWLVGGTDAHAKNYSLLLAGPQVRLAPLYDVASALPYDDLDPRRLRLAMRVGRHYRVTDITGRQWAALAEEVGADPTALLQRGRALAEALPEAMAQACADPAVVALGSDLPSRLAERVGAHARRCARLLRP